MNVLDLDLNNEVLSPEQLEKEYETGLRQVEAGIQELAANAYGHRIVYFRVMRQGATEWKSYHFHFLLSKRSGRHVAVCLDTDDVIPTGASSPDRKVFMQVAEAAIEGFLKRAGYVDKHDDWMEKRLYFRRSDQRLWDGFNELKEKDFVSYARNAKANEIQIQGLIEENDIVMPDNERVNA